jgi:hypothetical protein
LKIQKGVRVRSEVVAAGGIVVRIIDAASRVCSVDLKQCGFILRKSKANQLQNTNVSLF